MPPSARSIHPSDPRRHVALAFGLWVASAIFAAGCIHVKVEPIHVTLDVNVKVDRALDDFFGELDKKSTTLNPASSAK